LWIIHLSKRTNSGGDENQMTPHKPGRSRAAVDPAKAIERAAKVRLTLSANAALDYILGTFKEKVWNEKKKISKPRKRGWTRKLKRKPGQ